MTALSIPSLIVDRALTPDLTDCGVQRLDSNQRPLPCQGSSIQSFNILYRRWGPPKPMSAITIAKLENAAISTSVRVFVEAPLVRKWIQFLYAHSRPTFVSPSSRTMSESPSATAARIERPSDDQDTRRAMNVALSPKSVI